jgi:hypothetical protein
MQSIKRALNRGNMRYNTVFVGDRPTFIDLERKSKRGNGAKWNIRPNGRANGKWMLVQRFNFNPQSQQL